MISQTCHKRRVLLVHVQKELVSILDCFQPTNKLRFEIRFESIAKGIVYKAIRLHCHRIHTEKETEKMS